MNHNSKEIKKAINTVLESFKYTNLKGEVERKYSDHFINKVIDMVIEQLEEENK